MSLLIVGCSNSTNDYVVASEKTLPSNFHEIAFERDKTPYFQYLVSKTVDQYGFEQTWNVFGFEKEVPNIDLNEKDAFFIGILESGSCPYKIENIEISSDQQTLIVPLSETEGDCTSDATPRTFVIDRDKGTGTLSQCFFYGADTLGQ